jgi:hypothetical protein
MIEEFVSPERELNRGRKGFSIIGVLLISVACVTVAGITISLLDSSSGAGRASTGSAVVYNYLQEAVEEGKAILKKSMDNTNPPPKYTDKAGVTDGTWIDESVTLLLSDTPSGISHPLGHAINRDLSQAALKGKGISGSGGNLLVRIYDMQYKPDRVTIPLEQTTDLSLLPPSLKISGGGSWGNALVDAIGPDEEPLNDGSGTGDASNAGVYMVRATLTVNGASGAKKWMLESAVIQSNNDL